MSMQLVCQSEDYFLHDVKIEDITHLLDSSVAEVA